MGDFVLLDTLNMSEYFFENTVLYGIGSELSPHFFCQQLNLHFRLDLKREFGNDWCLSLSKLVQPVSSKPAGLLFDFGRDESNTAEETDIIFPVFSDHILSSDTEFYVYTNKRKNHIYIRQQKQINYFLLIKNGQHMDFVKDIQTYLLKVPGILFCTRYDLQNINWKDNLIL